MPYKNPEKRRQCVRNSVRKHRETARANGAEPKQVWGHTHRKGKEWCFVDTEGANDPETGRQWTYLICAASIDRAWRLYRGRPLTTHEMLHFILTLPKNYKLGGFFFGYDVDQILRDVPEPTLRRLYGIGCEPKPVDWDDYRLAVFNRKLIIGCPEGPLPANAFEMEGRGIWDVGRFYQCKLTTAIDNWKVATPAEAAFVARMKDQRQSFDVPYFIEHVDELTSYSLTENRLGVKLQTAFDQLAAENGYPLTQWYGAGSMAKAMMKVEGVRDHLDNRRPFRTYKPPRGADVDKRLERHLPFSYFGGRFEIGAPGRYAPVYEYDLRSAYPAAYRMLPCLEHGEWIFRRNPPTGEPQPHSLYTVAWSIPPEHLFGPFPVRRKGGTIFYPQSGVQHRVWGEELIAAKLIWGDAISYQPGWWEYRGKCDCHPFDWIDRVYQLRRQIGKDVKGYPLKLGMNAAYGSLASALGAEYDEQARQFTEGWCEPRWAGMITAWCRARLLDALRAAGPLEDSPVIMFATDAIYSTAPIDLDTADVLGGWEAHSFPSGLLIQPGVYHLAGQDVKTKLKGRGVLQKDLQDHIDAFYEAWDRDGARGVVSIPLTPRYHGIRLQLHRGKLDGAWRWEAESRDIAFDPTTKREWRGGKWMPYDESWAEQQSAPSQHFLELIGHVSGAQASDEIGPQEAPLAVPDEQRLEQYLMECQPSGPYAD